MNTASSAVLPLSSSAAAVIVRRRLLCQNNFPISRSCCLYMTRRTNIGCPKLQAMASFSNDAEETQKRWLLVGLGNPGNAYTGTRHNVGFELLDFIAKAEKIAMKSELLRFQAVSGRGFIGDVPVILAKPQTFMNRSGFSVGQMVKYYKIPLNQFLLIFDDLDLPFGKLKLSPKGGHGGHNGVKNVIEHFKGNRVFPRLKIGIGRPPGQMDPSTFVLRPFNKKEREELDLAFQDGLEAVRLLVRDSFDKSATFVNTSKPMGTPDDFKSELNFVRDSNIEIFEKSEV